MIEGVDAPRGWSVIPRRLVGEGGKCERIGIHEGGCQSPRVCHWLGGTVVVFGVVKVGEVSEKGIGSQYIVVLVLDGLICRNHCCETVTRYGAKIAWGEVKPKKSIVVRTSEVYGDRSLHRLGWSIFAQQPNQLKSL